MKYRKSGIISGAPPVRSTVGISVSASQSIIRSTVSRVMISLRFGPAFTWQCTQMRLQSLPTLTCRISGRARRSEIDCSLSLCAKRFIPNSTAASAVAAFAVCFCRRVVILPLGFLRMAQRSTRTVERFRLGEWNVGNRIDKLKELAIGRFFVEVVGLVANGVTLAAFHPMIVIIQNLLERPAINHSLIALEACALFSFKCLDGDRAEFDSLHRAPWIDVVLENLNAVKTRIIERGKKTSFS